MKKSISLTLALLALLVLVGCDSGSGSAEISFSDLSISTVEYYEYYGDQLNFDNYTSSEFIDVYFYSSVDQALPDPGDYQCVIDPDSDLEVELLFGIRDESDKYTFVAKSGVVTVSGSTISFEDVTFYFYQYNDETEESTLIGEVTDSGTFTIID